MRTLAMQELDLLQKLEAAQRKIQLDSNVALRMRRTTSWIEKGHELLANDDFDSAFIMYWIAFNSLYASSQRKGEIPDSERDTFKIFFATLVSLEKGNEQIYNTIWDDFSGPIRSLLQNKHVYQPFWDFTLTGVGEDWERSFEGENKRALQAIADKRATDWLLLVIFDRLYLLRNQLVHGGATYQSSANRDQVMDGARILASLIPQFANVMLDNSGRNWGEPLYPYLGDALNR